MSREKGFFLYGKQIVSLKTEKKTTTWVKQLIKDGGKCLWAMQFSILIILNQLNVVVVAYLVPWVANMWTNSNNNRKQTLTQGCQDVYKIYMDGSFLCYKMFSALKCFHISNFQLIIQRNTLVLKTSPKQSYY